MTQFFEKEKETARKCDDYIDALRRRFAHSRWFDDDDGGGIHIEYDARKLRVSSTTRKRISEE